MKRITIRLLMLNILWLISVSLFAYDAEVDVIYHNLNSNNNTVEVANSNGFSLKVVASGNGVVNYKGTTIRNSAKSFTESFSSGIASYKVSIIPDNGYRVKTVNAGKWGDDQIAYWKDNWSRSNDQSISLQTTSSSTEINVEFESIPSTRYLIAVAKDGNGRISYRTYGDIAWQTDYLNENKNISFNVAEGTYTSFSFYPDSGYRIGSVTLNGTDVTSGLTDNNYTIKNVNRNTNINVTFEAIPVANYSLSISSSGYGSVNYSGTVINGVTKSFTVNEGNSATLTFTPNSGYKVGSLTVNNVDVTSSISNNKYTISNITKNTTVSVTFEANPATTYTLSITSSDTGYVTYSGTSIKGTVKYFTVNEGSSATLTFTPNSGYKVGSLIVNNVDVTSNISNNQYTISNINKNTAVRVTFVIMTYSLSITSSSNGYVNYLGHTINGTTNTFTVNEGASAILTFYPSSGYKIGSVKVNNVDVTSSVSNNMYTIRNINKNTTVSVTFEAITYSLSITSSGNGYVTYSGTTVNGTTKSFTVNEGVSATLTFTPNSGYKVGSLKVNNVDVTSSISNNRYTISNISKNTTVSVIFEAIPPTTYTLSITASDNGFVIYSGKAINGATQTFTVNAGAMATITIIPNNGYKISSLKVNNVDVTSSISDNKYTISNISKNTTVSVTFVAITYTLSITSSGNGYVTYSGTTINGTTKSFTVNEGTSATLTFTPNSGYKVGSLKVNNVDVTSSISNNKYTISNISKNTTVSVTFVAITYSLLITSSGKGYVTYSGTSINGTAKTFTVNEGTSATLTFTPNSGYKVGSLKVNNVDVTSSISNNKYTISNISKNTTVSVTFVAITYTLSITSSGNGYVTYSGTTINGTTKSFTVNEGTSATLTFTPNSGYKVGILKVNNADVTSSISNNNYTISNISKNTTVSVTFVAITYTLSITSSGNGYVSYSGTKINGTTIIFTVNEGTSPTLTFTPNSGYKVGSLIVNNVDVTSSISNNKYTISNISKNITVNVTFVEGLKSMSVNGISYTVTSYGNKTVSVSGGSYGNVLTVPATFAYDGATWSVTGIQSRALDANADIAAIIWNPSVVFDASVNNPNLLLYVKAAQYAPASINNVVVNGVANSITLTEASSGNDFYCPQVFTAKSISYTHNYSMTTGVNECRGWETIVLPFDVLTIKHNSKGEIVPFGKWSSSDSRRPFWLYELTSNGWQEAETINAYTPYIISMPNNDKYYDEARLNGSVTFSATNVRVEPTNVSSVTYQGKTFTPNFSTKATNGSIFALNVVNSWATEKGNMTEGSQFVKNLRTVHPFEAYMTTTNSTRSSFGIFEDMSTEIRGIRELMGSKQSKSVYNLKGQKMDEDGKLPAGVYIVNGQKMMVK